MKDKPYVKGVEINVEFKETINIGDFSNIQPTYGEKLIISTDLLPEGLILDRVRATHIDYVRAKYLEVRQQMLSDTMPQSKPLKRRS